MKQGSEKIFAFILLLAVLFCLQISVSAADAGETHAEHHFGGEVKIDHTANIYYRECQDIGCDEIEILARIADLQFVLDADLVDHSGDLIDETAAVYVDQCRVAVTVSLRSAAGTEVHSFDFSLKYNSDLFVCETSGQEPIYRTPFGSKCTLCVNPVDSDGAYQYIRVSGTVNGDRTIVDETLITLYFTIHTNNHVYNTPDLLTPRADTTPADTSFTISDDPDDKIGEASLLWCLTNENAAGETVLLELKQGESILSTASDIAIKRRLDINEDGVLDMTDLAQLQRHIENKTYHILADADWNGKIDASDLKLLRDAITIESSEPEVHIHTPGAAATCYTPQLCITCGETLKAAAHTPISIAAVAATCKTDGTTEGKLCSTCGLIIKKVEVIPAHGHLETVVVGRPASCTEDGISDFEQCLLCGECLTQPETLPALGHKTEIIAGKEATCAEAGFTEAENCTVCQTVLKAAVEIPIAKHTEATEVTCGKEAKTCPICGFELVSKTAHTEKILLGKEASCTETGLTEGIVCEVCGLELAKQTVIPAKGHTVVIDAAYAPDYHVKGRTEGMHCAVCHEILKAQEPIAEKSLVLPIVIVIAAGTAAAVLFPFPKKRKRHKHRRSRFFRNAKRRHGSS